MQVRFEGAMKRRKEFKIRRKEKRDGLELRSLVRQMRKAHARRTFVFHSFRVIPAPLFYSSISLGYFEVINPNTWNK